MVAPSERLQLRLDYRPDLFERGSVEVLAGRLVRLLEAAGAGPDVAIGGLEILSAAGRGPPLEDWDGTERAVPAAALPQLCGGRGGATAGGGCGCVCGRAAQLWRAGGARQPVGASSARARGGSGERGGGVPGALAGAGGLSARHPQGRRRLSAARPRLSSRALELHAGGCRGGAAAHAVGAGRSGGGARRAAAGA